MKYAQKLVQTAATLTSTLLKHHVAPKLESILDRESKVTHETLSVQIEARLGSGEGDNAKGPDMKVWGKGKDLTNVGTLAMIPCAMPNPPLRLTGNPPSFVTPRSSYRSLRRAATICDTPSTPRRITLRTKVSFLFHSVSDTNPTPRTSGERSLLTPTR